MRKFSKSTGPSRYVAVVAPDASDPLNALTVPKVKFEDDNAYVQTRLAAKGWDICLQFSWSDTADGHMTAEQIQQYRGFLQLNAASRVVVRLPQAASNLMEEADWAKSVNFDTDVVSILTDYPVSELTICFANEIGLRGVGSYRGSHSTYDALYLAWLADYTANPADPTLPDRWDAIVWDIPMASAKGTVAPHLTKYWAHRLSSSSWPAAALICGSSFQLTNANYATELSTFLATEFGPDLIAGSDYVGSNQYGDRWNGTETAEGYAARFKTNKVTNKASYLAAYGITKPVMLTEYGVVDGNEHIVGGATDYDRLANLREALIRADLGVRKCYFTSLSGNAAEVGYGIYLEDPESTYAPVGREIGPVD